MTFLSIQVTPLTASQIRTHCFVFKQQTALQLKKAHLLQLYLSTASAPAIEHSAEGDISAVPIAHDLNFPSNSADTATNTAIQNEALRSPTDLVDDGTIGPVRLLLAVPGSRPGCFPLSAAAPPQSTVNELAALQMSVRELATATTTM